MKKVFKPRPVQLAGLEMTLSQERANLFASPGVGKTLTTLATLDTRYLAGEKVFPALIVAPLRVANTVWDTEVARWENFEYLTVSKIIGTPTERKVALAKKAHIYTINFENLPWLREQLGDNWCFPTVIIDESTKIRGHRCRLSYAKDGTVRGTINGDGSSKNRTGRKNATAIAGRARATSFWYNLSGTPTPKGAVDLWAQQWVIDWGKALGNSFTEFTRNFCRLPYGANPEHNRWEVIPWLVDTVTDLIKPNTVVLDAYDWFDIDRPIEVNVPVNLPPKAREMYAKMHNDSVTELLSGKDLESPSLAGQIMKCRQIASGAVLDEDGNLHHIHDARLEALADLYERNDKVPLLVAYHFRYEKDAIIKYFGDKVAVPLPNGKQQAEVEARWNAGKIPLLLVHPASAGHGLNLQYGSNHIVIFTPDWDYELYAQVIERIGSTRQAQAGFNRPVYVHRLFAPNTWDEVILEKLSQKHSMSELIKLALAVKDKSILELD